MKGLAGRLALVTGGTGLIGGAVARRLAAEGARVVVASRSREKAEKWIESSGGGTLIPWGLDLSNTPAVEDSVDRLVQAHGVPSVMVAAASRREGLGVPPSDLEHAHFEALFGTDVAGHYVCAREIVERLGPQESGSVVWLSSVYADRAADPAIYPQGMTATPLQYGAVKSAVSGLVTHLAAQWGPRGVRVNAVVAGGVRSEARQPAEFVERYSRKTMLGRMGAAEEVAAAVAFLASDEASYVTAACLLVDGGFSRW